MKESVSTYSLQALSSPLDAGQAKHLLDRCLFGAKKSEVDAFVGKTIEEALNILTALPPEVPLPIGIRAEDLEVPIGNSWINTKDNTNYAGYRLYSLHSWWLGNLQQQRIFLTEKMILFGHNHWVTKGDTVWNSSFLYQYNQLLRKYALGNWKQLASEMCILPAMLSFLNGNANKIGAPNENFARELFELFTIGKGPLIGEGNYTTYTETDVEEAAKVLTGWRNNGSTASSYFDTKLHDSSTKTFSPAFGNQTIANQQGEEYKLLIDMIFSQKETARFLTRKIYRWFTYYQIDQVIEDQVIEPLATTLFDNNYEIKPLLVQLLSSEHFFSADYRGAMIKNPMDFSIGLLHKLELELSPDQLSNYQFWWDLVYVYISNMGMLLSQPPDIAGWTPFYQAPGFNELWINSATVPARTTFSNLLCGSGITKNGFKYGIDPLLLSVQISEAGNPNALIGGLAEVLFSLPISTKKSTQLKEILLPGLSDSTWTTEWNKYLNAPTNETQKDVLRKRLTPLIAAMLKMPEFYLC